MNIDDLFKLFSDEDRELSKDKLPVLDFTEHPVYWVGMFTKIIRNHNGFDSYIKQVFNKLTPELEVELGKMEELGDWVTFNRAWYYIEKLDLTSEFHYEYLISSGTKDTLLALEITIAHFERFEEYEKCSHLHKIKKELQEFIK